MSICTQHRSRSGKPQPFHLRGLIHLFISFFSSLHPPAASSLAQGACGTISATATHTERSADTCLTTPVEGAGAGGAGEAVKGTGSRGGTPKPLRTPGMRRGAQEEPPPRRAAEGRAWGRPEGTAAPPRRCTPRWVCPGPSVVCTGDTGDVAVSLDGRRERMGGGREEGGGFWVNELVLQPREVHRFRAGCAF